MRLDLQQIENEIVPLLVVHGVELVALEWFRGPGHGILRVTIDLPGGSPERQDPSLSVSLDVVTDVTRDISTAMDALDLIEGSYTLEVGSPGPERPIQKRADFDRFAGLRARLDTRKGASGKASFSGILRGTVDHPESGSSSGEGGFAVRIEVQDKSYEIPASQLSRAHLHEVVSAPKPKPGKVASRRQERLAARERARAINAAHVIAKLSAPAETETEAKTETKTETVDTVSSGAHEGSEASGHHAGDPHSPTTALRVGYEPVAEQAHKATR